MSQAFTRCGLAWDKGRLGAPGLGGWKSVLFERPVSVILLLQACTIEALLRHSGFTSAY
jgi:hypothetical protein